MILITAGANISQCLGLATYRQINKRCIHGTCLPSNRQGPDGGQQCSHANNKTKRRFLPNLQSRRFWVESENRWVRLRVSAKAIRTIDKNGIDAVLADLRARGEVV